MELNQHDYDDRSDRLPLSLLSANIDEVTLANADFTPSERFVELAVYPPMSNTLSMTSRKPEAGEIVILQVGPNTMKQAVGQRDDDILTPQQLK